jgi:CRISPR-associated DxTHG motif protein
MSRRPTKDTPDIPMHAALSPFGVIDFADNHLASNSSLATLTSLASLSASAGPPAYLEAHGIRYVPVMAAEGALDMDSPAGNYVPMSRDAGAAQVVVSQRELNTRVDDRIKKFLKPDSGDSLRSMRSDMERLDDVEPRRGPRRSDMRSAASLDAEWRDLRRDCEAATRRSAALQSKVMQDAW